jgi:hypothetical protein
MPCKHLRDLYDVCQAHNLKLSSTDLIRIVCPSCGVEDVCPSVLCEDYEAKHAGDEATAEGTEEGGVESGA